MRTLLILPAFMAAFAATLGVLAALTLPSWDIRAPQVCRLTPDTFATAFLLPKELLPRLPSEPDFREETLLERSSH